MLSEIQILNSNTALNKFASHTDSFAFKEDLAKSEENSGKIITTNIASTSNEETTLVKRPLSEKSKDLIKVAENLDVNPSKEDPSSTSKNE